MKMHLLLAGLCGMLTLSAHALVGQSPQATGHETDYLGQPRPGDTPVIFAPGVVSTDAGMYGTIVFSPDRNEAFWAKDEHPALFFSSLVDGRWSTSGSC